MTSQPKLTDLPAFGELQHSARRLLSANISSLFTTEAGRARTFSTEAAGLRLDYSRQLLDNKARKQLLALATQARLPDQIQALLSGAEVNNTEHRPALHSLLRASSAPAKLADKFSEVQACRSQMQNWANKINTGQHKGFSGQAISDIVNIGIGGSDLGPRLVSEALQAFVGGITCHYTANLDPADLQGTLQKLNPASTLFIICSKSFRTEETLINGRSARQWLLQTGATETDLNRHFLAVTTNLAAAADFGISPDHCLPLWDWVGGRYSLWSAVGLSCAIGLGWSHFEALLAGAAAMDEHFACAPLTDNMPVLTSLLEIWCCNGLGAASQAVLPYDHGLARLPDFLQQLSMESNGKGVRCNGSQLDCDSAPILWGSAGSIGQHSYFELLHQGTRLCPADFILPLTSHTTMKQQHRRLVANCLAQSRALLVGQSLDQAHQRLRARGLSESEAGTLAPHLVMPGNRPHNIISFQALTPQTLGALLALYEHKTYCCGQLWGVNSFDQWGVELGKEIAADLLGRMEDQQANESTSGELDPATEQLLIQWRKSQSPN